MLMSWLEFGQISGQLLLARTYLGPRSATMNHKQFMPRLPPAVPNLITANFAEIFLIFW